MGLFRSDIEFWDAFTRLNALNGIGIHGWETPTARKPHIDEFGVEIETGDQYFRRKTGSSGYSFIVVSRRSMEKMAYALVRSSPPAEMFCDQLLQQQGTPLPSSAAQAI